MADPRLPEQHDPPPRELRSPEGDARSTDAPHLADDAPARWGSVIDLGACTGCHACTVACETEHGTPLGVSRTRVRVVEVGVWPQVRRDYQINRCHQCETAPCATICPTGALVRRPDGIVDVERSACVGCKACVAACPFDALAMNPATGGVEKCNLCAHRLDVGLAPACVSACPTGAISVGDLRDPRDPVARLAASGTQGRPRLGLRTRLWTIGGSPAAIDPLGARRPEGGLFQAAEQGENPLAPRPPGLVAGAVVVQDALTRGGWDYRLSLMVWAREIAAGAWLAPALLVGLGILPGDDVLWRLIAPVIAGIYLLSAVLLSYFDLEQRSRSRLILTRPNWRSWIARTAWLQIGFGAALLLHLGASLLHLHILGALALLTLPLAIGVAVGSALAFRQCPGRSLWQSPLGPPRMLVSAVTAGAAMLLPFAEVLAPGTLAAMAWTLAVGCLLQIALIGAETWKPPPGPVGAQGFHEMTYGAWRGFFWAGAALTAIGLLAPIVGAWCTPLALAGLLMHEHARAQSAWSVAQS